jgi:hypothetical protein
MKKCIVCKLEKEDDKFHSNKVAKDKLDSRCKFCVSILRKERYAKNKFDEDAKNRQRYLLNKEKYDKAQIEWRLKNPHRGKTDYWKNREKHLINNKIYRQTIPGIYASIKISAKRRNKEVIITLEEFEKWYKEQKQECYYCKRTTEECLNSKDNFNSKRLTIDRKESNIGYQKGNLALSCWTCNLIKYNYFTEKEMLEIIGPLIALKERNSNKEK